jgi:hypothetical protein
MTSGAENPRLGRRIKVRIKVLAGLDGGPYTSMLNMADMVY